MMGLSLVLKEKKKPMPTSFACPSAAPYTFLSIQRRYNKNYAALSRHHAQQTHQSMGVSVSHNKQKRKRHPNHNHYCYIYHGFVKPPGILIIRSVKSELALDGPGRPTYTTVCTRCQLFGPQTLFRLIRVSKTMTGSLTSAILAAHIVLHAVIEID